MSEYIYEQHDQPARVVRDGWNVKIEWDFVQREEIVRCRDCKRFHTNTNGLDCPKLDPDGFCAWGERREP